MTPETENLGISIVKGACNSEAKELAVDWSEFGLDALLDNDLLKGAPMIGTIVKFCTISKTIRDRLFLKKVLGFLCACPKFTDEEKEAFIRQHLNDVQKAKKLGDAIVLILDKLDDLEKPEMLAKVFAAFVRGKIPHECFRRLASAIDIGFIEDLKVLAYKPKVYLFPYLPNLVRTNLADFQAHENFKDYSEGEVGIGFNISPLGEIFVKCMNDSF